MCVCEPNGLIQYIGLMYEYLDNGHRIFLQTWLTGSGNLVKKWPVIQSALRKPINDFKGLKVTHTSRLPIYVCMYMYIYTYV